jgi:ATP-dependent exoDNAse (exonuclease V) alpha subunit
VQWGIYKFKVNDPILFNELDRFMPVVYNNMKGKIAKIAILNAGKITEQIEFDIELDKIILGIDAQGQDFELLENAKSGNSIIRFRVNKTKCEDEDGDGSFWSKRSVLPFEVAYAVSIHKAQGLEYDSVKIIITDEIDELISHNIFYTAITRTRNKLKIYWTPEVEKKVLGSIKPKNISKDVALLKSIP